MRCEKCNRTFEKEAAFRQHLRDSPAHATTFECQLCKRAFRSKQALQQHQESPAHSVTIRCDLCHREFNSKQALRRHTEEQHQTPLDAFFTSFTSFAYDPRLPPSQSFHALKVHKGWAKGDRESEEAWSRYQDALRAELGLWYGAEDDLVAWHTLCRAIGVHPLPSTCEGCQKAVRNTHVNIVDLIDWSRQGGSDDSRVRTFQSVEKLKRYSKDTGKIFSHNVIEKESSNVVLRHLLRRLFTHRIR